MADGPYENLDLQQIDDATYATIEPNKEGDLQKILHLQNILQSDIRRYGRVGVGVGLLCAVLALLNIAVPLYLYQSNMVERQQLLSSFEQLETRYDQLQIKNNNLTEERDDLKRRLCCGPGWQTFDRGCYYISTETKNWTESRQWCRDRQSDLVVIKSQEKQDFFERLGQTVWLGLTDSNKEGLFQWVDGTPLTTATFWGSDQPDNHANEEDCVEFRASRGWNDLPCSHRKYWICEKVLC